MNTFTADTTPGVLIGLTMSMALANWILFFIITFVRKEAIFTANFDGYIGYFFFMTRCVLFVPIIIYMIDSKATALTLFFSVIMAISLTIYNFSQSWQFKRYEHARRAVGLA